MNTEKGRPATDRATHSTRLTDNRDAVDYVAQRTPTMSTVDSAQPAVLAEPFEVRFDRQINALGTDILTVASEIESCWMRLDELSGGQATTNRLLERIAESLEIVAGLSTAGEVARRDRDSA